MVPQAGRAHKAEKLLSSKGQGQSTTKASAKEEQPSSRKQKKRPQGGHQHYRWGFVGSRNSNSAQKRQLKDVHQVNAVSFWSRMPPITFIDDDFKGVDYR